MSERNVDGIGLPGCEPDRAADDLDRGGLAPALERLVAEWSDRAGIVATFRSSLIQPGRTPFIVNFTACRVVRAVLADVAGRAGASSVGVVVVVRPGRFVSVAIADDGAGLDPEATPGGRLALAEVRESAMLVGGSVAIESDLGSGTTFFLRLPILDSPTELAARNGSIF